MSDCQWVAYRVESWTNRGVSYCIVQPCLLACGVQVWSTSTTVDGEGECHVGSCQWTRSDEGWALGLDRGIRVPALSTGRVHPQTAHTLNKPQAIHMDYLGATSSRYACVHPRNSVFNQKTSNRGLTLSAWWPPRDGSVPGVRLHLNLRTTSLIPCLPRPTNHSLSLSGRKQVSLVRFLPLSYKREGPPPSTHTPAVTQFSGNTRGGNEPSRARLGSFTYRAKLGSVRPSGELGKPARLGSLRAREPARRANEPSHKCKYSL
jgi:hypothetical protein